MIDMSLSRLFVILGLLAVLLELFVGVQVGFDLVVIGSILVVSGLAGELVGQTYVTFLVAIVLSTAYLLFFRKLLRKSISPSTQPHMSVDRLISREAHVLSTISPKKAGKVQVEDEVWRATSAESIAAGESVLIEQIHGVSVVVRKK